MMKIYFVLAIPLMGIGSVLCGPSVDELLNPQHYNLYTFLSWINAFAKQYKANKPTYDTMFTKYSDKFGLEEYPSQSKKLSEAISKSVAFRKVLVNVDDYHALGESIEDNTDMLMNFFVSMDDILSDLQKRLLEWEKHKADVKPISRITDDIPFEWFTKHGFFASTINDITLDELRSALDELYGERITAFGDILEFVGTCFFLQPAPNTAAKLIWLASFGGSEAAMDYLERYVKQDGCNVPPAVADRLVNAVGQIGKPEGKISHMIWNSIDVDTYMYYKKTLPGAMIIESKMPIYIDVLIEICKDLEKEMLNFEQELKSGGMESLANLFDHHGFDVDASTLKTILKQIKDLKEETSSVMALFKVMKESTNDYTTKIAISSESNVDEENSVPADEEDHSGDKKEGDDAGKTDSSEEPSGEDDNRAISNFRLDSGYLNNFIDSIGVIGSIVCCIAALG